MSGAVAVAARITASKAAAKAAAQAKAAKGKAGAGAAAGVGSGQGQGQGLQGKGGSGKAKQPPVPKRVTADEVARRLLAERAARKRPKNRATLRGAAAKQPGAALGLAGVPGVAKGGRKGGGMVVIPAAMGRDASGPDALAALRARLAAVGPKPK